MKYVFKKILRILAKRYLARYKPTIIAITGSVGKTSTREAVYAVLKRKFTVWTNKKNFNNEFGVPLTILGLDPDMNGFAGVRLFLAILRSFLYAYLPIGLNYPKILVIEVAADRPGDIQYLAEMISPDIAVMTAIGSVPVHIEYYDSVDQLVEEKSHLLRALKNDGLAILNFDDPRVIEASKFCNAEIKSFGFGNDHTIRFDNIRYSSDMNLLSIGLIFDYICGDERLSVHLKGIIGKHIIYSCLPAIYIGFRFGLTGSEILQAFERFQLLPGRMRLLAGNNDSIIIDDSYNASPLSTRFALESLNDFSTVCDQISNTRHRKVVVLGDLLELGKYSEDAHRKMGMHAAQIADIFYIIGNYRAYTVDGIKSMKPASEIMEFNNSHEAASFLKNNIQYGDIVLIKGSQSMRMERITKVLLLDKQTAREVLPRQSKDWLKKP